MHLCPEEVLRLERSAQVLRALPLNFAEEKAFRAALRIEIGDLLIT